MSSQESHLKASSRSVLHYSVFMSSVVSCPIIIIIITYVIPLGKFSFQLYSADPVLPTRSTREGELNTFLTWLGIVPGTTRGSGSPGGLPNPSSMAQLMSRCCAGHVCTVTFTSVDSVDVTDG